MLALSVETGFYTHVSSPRTLGEAVAVARRRAGMSARELSARAAVSPSYVTKLEADGVDPSLRIFSRIVRAVGMNRQEILYCIALASTDHPTPNVPD